MSQYTDKARTTTTFKCTVGCNVCLICFGVRRACGGAQKKIVAIHWNRVTELTMHIALHVAASRRLHHDAAEHLSKHPRSDFVLSLFEESYGCIFDNLSYSNFSEARSRAYRCDADTVQYTVCRIHSLIRNVFYSYRNARRGRVGWRLERRNQVCN